MLYTKDMKTSCAADCTEMVNLYLTWAKVRPSVRGELPPTDFVDLLSNLGFSSYEIVRFWDQFTVTELLSFLTQFQELGFEAATSILLSVEEAADFAERMYELCLLFGIELSADERKMELYKYAIIGLNGRVIEQLKYSTNLMFCHYYGLELPKKCSWYLALRLFPRRLRVWYGRHRQRKNRKTQQLVYSVFQGFKKGLLPVRVEKVFQTLQSHAKALSAEGKTPKAALDVTRRTGEWFTSALRLSSSGKKSKKRDEIAAASVRPSTRISRKSTLQFGYGQGSTALLESSFLNRSHVFQENFYQESFDHWTRFREDRLPYVDQLAGYIYKKDYEPIIVYAVGPSSCELWEELQNFSMLVINKKPDVSPYCILEPMKVRTITKADAWQYPGLKDLQKFWWSTLKGYETFQIIGDPDVSMPCNKLVQLAASDPTLGFASGDYSAATDKMHGDVTEMLIQTVGKDLDILTQKAVYNALCNSTISYSTSCLPRDSGSVFGNVIKEVSRRYKENASCDEDIFSIPPMFRLPDDIHQSNGQLMGSILSFPLLCLGNYSCFHYAVESFLGRKYPILELPMPYRQVFINGDDILFTANKSFYDHWVDCLPLFGFDPSIGKNLYSRDVLQINSVLHYARFYHDFESGKSSGIMETIPYVNFGLITNRKKQDCSKDTSNLINTLSCKRVGEWAVDTKKGSAPVDINDLHGRIRVLPKIQETLLDGLTPDLARITNQLFWKHSRYVERLFPGLHCFLPEDRGGLGLKDLGIEQLASSIRKYRGFLSYVYQSELSSEVSRSRELFGSEFPLMQSFEDSFTPFEKYNKWKKMSAKVASDLIPSEWVRSATGSSSVLRWLPR